MSWRNGDDLDGRARRPCACGATMYDWGVGAASVARPENDEHIWVIEWKCHGGCGRGTGHRLSYPEICTIRRGTQAEKDASALTLVDRPHWNAWPSIEGTKR